MLEKSTAHIIKSQKAQKRRTEQAVNDNFPLLLVLFAIGIGIYFNMPGEVSPQNIAILVLLLLVATISSFKYHLLNNCLLAALIISLGFGAALYRTHSIATPLLSKNFKPYEISFMVETNEPLQTTRIRYTGKLLFLSNTDKNKTPVRLRIRTTDQGPRFQYGDVVCARAMLARPKGPLRPGGYDFGRALWYKQIGATGFNISPLKLCSRQDSQETVHHQSLSDQIIANIRSFIGNKIDNGLAGPESARERAMARALILGDRGRVQKEDLEAMRKAGLGHLLAISGLHMAVFAGTLFFAIRALLALFPIFAQNYPIKKYAAFIALIGGVAYFLISGQSIPTQRAVLMISVLFTAIMIERSALTLRNVAMAALIILILRPESLLSAGFQMSFAAVTALIITYQYARNWDPFKPKGNAHKPVISSSWFKPLYYLGGIWLTSIIATLATAPFAIYHFHSVSYMGPVGNMLAIPVFSFLLMPSALLSLILMPFGLEILGLLPLKISIDILLSSAHWTASFDPAIITIGAISLSSVLFILAGIAILYFVKKPQNYLGAALLIVGIYTAKDYEKPDLYIAPSAELIALRGPDDFFYAPTGRKGNFVLKSWLKADGDTRSLNLVRNSSYFTCDDSACSGETKGQKVTLLKSLAALEEACQTADIVIYKFPIRRSCKKPKLILTKSELGESGTISIFINDGKIKSVTANQFRKTRIWSSYQ